MILVHADWPAELIERLRKETGEETTAALNPDHALLARTDILLAPQLDEAFLARCPQVKLLYILSAGVERLPFAALSQRQITVANASGLHPRHMSEQILGVMIGFSRRLFHHRDNQHLRLWERGLLPDELGGHTLLIIGAGRIGQAVAKRAKAFEMRVLGLKSSPDPLPDFDEVWPTDRLYDALPQADYVLLLTPLTPKTREIMGAAAFARMKKGAVFLNYARGGTVDEPALIAALQSGAIGGAGLDVFEDEPLPSSNPLWGMPNVMITPHNGGSIQNYDAHALDIFLQNYRAWKAGQPLPTQVNLARKY